MPSSRATQSLGGLAERPDRWQGPRDASGMLVGTTRWASVTDGRAA